MVRQNFVADRKEDAEPARRVVLQGGVLAKTTGLESQETSCPESRCSRGLADRLNSFEIRDFWDHRNRFGPDVDDFVAVQITTAQQPGFVSR